MKLLHFEQLSEKETLSRFKQTRLKGFNQPLIYENSTLKLERNVDTNRLIPTQKYLLYKNVDILFELHEQFKKHGIDIFHLNGVILFYVENNGVEEGPIPLSPPIVENTLDKDGKYIWLINDGMHRIISARSIGSTINVILVDNIPKEYPYYAYPLDNKWKDVDVISEIPRGYVKKRYRNPVNPYDLFRNFNEVFEGIQKSR